MMQKPGRSRNMRGTFCLVIAILTVNFCHMVTSYKTSTKYLSKSRRMYCLATTHDEVLLRESWENFAKNHVGRWCGIQSCHYHRDEEDSSVSDRILCGTLLTQKDEGIDHTNFYVSSPVDFESDVAITADKILLQNVAVYQKSTLSSKVCGSVALGGPRMSREGLSLQYSFRHGDCRMRVMIAYEPSDFVTVPSTSIQVPSSLSMSDITISRELRLMDGVTTPVLTSLPSANSFTSVSSNFLWRKTSVDGDFGGKFSGVKDIYRGLGSTVDSPAQEVVSSTALPIFEDYDESFREALSEGKVLEEASVDGDDEDDLDFVKTYDGGLLIEAPLVILVGEESDVRVSWSVPTLEASASAAPRTVYVAEASFTAMNDALNKTRRKRRGDTFIDQPILLDFTVQTLHKE